MGGRDHGVRGLAVHLVLLLWLVFAHILVKLEVRPAVVPGRPILEGAKYNYSA